MSNDWALHHIGVAVAALEPAIDVHERVFGLELDSGPFDDPRQGVKVVFLADPKGQSPLFELVAPLGTESPVAAYLSRGIGAYHACYLVDDIEAALRHAEEQRCIVVSEPVPAVAFDGRRIAWFFTPTRQLTELVERAPADQAAT